MNLWLAVGKAVGVLCLTRPASALWVGKRALGPPGCEREGSNRITKQRRVEDSVASFEPSASRLMHYYAIVRSLVVLAIIGCSSVVTLKQAPSFRSSRSCTPPLATSYTLPPSWARNRSILLYAHGWRHQPDQGACRVWGGGNRC